MPEEFWLTDSVFTVDGLFTPEECAEYIRISEDVGYEDALVSSPDGLVRRTDVRNNERVMFANEPMAAVLWERAADFVPSEHDDRPAVGVNELLRFYRYDPGQLFNWHQDIPFVRENGERSEWTFMVYLNDDFDGGATAFEDSYSDESFEPFEVLPKRGTALFFVHDTHHIGDVVTRGRKYVLRTDVMYAADESLDGPDDDADPYDSFDGD